MINKYYTDNTRSASKAELGCNSMLVMSNKIRGYADMREQCLARA